MFAFLNREMLIVKDVNIVFLYHLFEIRISVPVLTV